MYRITYDIWAKDPNGEIHFIDDYKVWFQKTDPSGESVQWKKTIGAYSCQNKNPGFQVLRVSIVSEGYVDSFLD